MSTHAEREQNAQIAYEMLRESYENKTAPVLRNTSSWHTHVSASLVRCPHCSEMYLPGTDHDEDCEGVTCMWCGKTYPPTLIDAHEEGCA